MPESLQDLESRRAEIAKQFARLGDLRSGSISNTSGRCGKPNCRCHQPVQPRSEPAIAAAMRSGLGLGGWVTKDHCTGAKNWNGRSCSSSSSLNGRRHRGYRWPRPCSHSFFLNGRSNRGETFRNSVRAG